ncbi:RDD family protein [Marinomonas sp. S3726]|uniref:RDD family protein n=1 Tax=Marinomonas sp. S3726 TaxID=579484 RepID=UPI0005F9B3DC|nr:RDD family protein [Marinomonas sp. S3726]
MEYAGFWKRFWSFCLDTLIMAPIIAFTFWGNEQSRLFQLYYLIPNLLFGLWFYVYLVKRYGGTPGKLILKIKITKLDGSDVSYREAALRYSVLFVLSIFSAIPMILAAQGMSDTEYFSMNWQERSLVLIERSPSWYNLVSIAMNVWVWSEFIVMLTNKKRRAIHDFIAGTIVINRPLPNKTLNSDAASVAG